MSQRTPNLSLEAKHYEPLAVEQAIYQLWEKNKVFEPSPDASKPCFSIVIPPPNVTGRLHMGHALNNSVQDTLIRYKRMDGFAALWIPGTDHAGISTQSVVKKHLDAEGINYLELGREKMIERVWEWKQKYGDQILNQLRRLGSSCDWTRTRFTMDADLSRSVREAFVRLYESGLIYRGKYIVNWCPVDRTALSDDEVDTSEGGEPGFLWHFRYPLAEDPSRFVVIATTRPETLLGDTAVAVHPSDNRYSDLVGKKVLLPLVGREIPIIADEYVEKEFGSGCLKVTPGHDPNDFQIGLRHGLEQINVMNPDATMGDQAPAAYHGLDRFKCRERIVQEMDQLGLLESVESRMTPVGRAQRSGAIIEYRLSDQWFVKMRPLAEQALKHSDSGALKLFPERWDRIYRHWLENTRDWCISRQIWWGHQIPAWHNTVSGEIIVARETPEVAKQNPGDWVQDSDVLDTWFSSALWPYSTMGWPEATNDLARFYPTSVLSTAKDIIYFWVARMVMTGVEFMGAVPFREVYFHPVICDAKGETMSKSKGNGIDPLHVIQGASMTDLEGPIHEARPENMAHLLSELRKAYPEGFKAVGADALRVTLLSLNSQAQQVQLSLQKFEDIGKRFVDKLWNASRFIISKLEDSPGTTELSAQSHLSSQSHLEDRWILGRLDQTVQQVRLGFDTYSFNEAVNAIYRFFWDDFCDWYVELSKFRFKHADPSEVRQVQLVSAECLSTILKLLHPIAPFVTEELYGHLSPKLRACGIAQDEGSLLALAPFPRSKSREDSVALNAVALAQSIVREVRNMRAHAGIGQSVQLQVLLRTESQAKQQTIRDGVSIVLRGANLKSLDFTTEKPERFALAVSEGVEIFANLAEHLDVPAEIARNEAQLLKVEKEILSLQGRLGNAGFMNKAPDNVKAEYQQNLTEAEGKKEKLEEVLRELRSLV